MKTEIFVALFVDHDDSISVERIQEGVRERLEGETVVRSDEGCRSTAVVDEIATSVGKRYGS